MFEDVAVPDVEEFLSWSYGCSVRQIETHDDTGHISGIGLDRVLACRTFVAFRGHGLTGEDEFAGLLIGRDVEGLTIQHLKLHKVNVQGMDVASDVDEGPDLSTAGLWVFGDRFVPARVAQAGR